MNQDKKFDLVLIQYQESSNTFRTQVTLVVQIITALIIANITLAGFAFENKSALLLILGAFFPLTILLLVFFAKRLMTPFIENCISIEKKYLNEKDTKMITDFVKKTQKKKVQKNLDKLTYTNSILSKFIFICLMVGQVILGIAFYCRLDWTLF